MSQQIEVVTAVYAKDNGVVVERVTLELPDGTRIVAAGDTWVKTAPAVEVR